MLHWNCYVLELCKHLDDPFTNVEMIFKFAVSVHLFIAYFTQCFFSGPGLKVVGSIQLHTAGSMYHL